MTFNEIMTALESFSNEDTKRVLTKHGAKEPFFGVKVADLKKIVKKVKKDHALSLALYNTGNSDAMYLAALIADEKMISEDELDVWVSQAYWYYLSEYAVPWVAAETPFGFNLGLKWIKSAKENTIAAGWSTLASYCSLHKDEELDLPKYKSLLQYVKSNIHSQENRVRYAMNAFVISVGTYIHELNQECSQIGKVIGPVAVDMNGTACKVPLIPDYLLKVEKRGAIGKKRKTARC